MTSSLRIHATAEGAILAIKVVPGASRDRVVGVLGNAMKIAVSKPPEGGAANRAVVQLLAKALGLPPKHVEVVKGQTSPRKELLVRGLSVDELQTRLGKALTP